MSMRMSASYAVTLPSRIFLDCSQPVMSTSPNFHGVCDALAFAHSEGIVHGRSPRAHPRRRIGEVLITGWEQSKKIREGNVTAYEADIRIDIAASATSSTTSSRSRPHRRRQEGRDRPAQQLENAQGPVDADPADPHHPRRRRLPAP